MANTRRNSKKLSKDGIGGTLKRQKYVKQSASMSRCTLYCHSKTKGSGNRYLYAQFNPTSLPYDLNANFVEITAPGMNYPVLQYVGGKVSRFSVELYFHDIPYTGSIAKDRKWLEGLLPPKKNKKKAFEPPLVKFKWGYFSCACVAESMHVEDALLDLKGRPLITTITMDMIITGNTSKWS